MLLQNFRKGLVCTNLKVARENSVSATGAVSVGFYLPLFFTMYIVGNNDVKIISSVLNLKDNASWSAWNASGSVWRILVASSIRILSGFERRAHQKLKNLDIWLLYLQLFLSIIDSIFAYGLAMPYVGDVRYTRGISFQSTFVDVWT